MLRRLPDRSITKSMAFFAVSTSMVIRRPVPKSPVEAKQYWQRRLMAVDVNSGAVHVLDNAAYDVLSLLDAPMADICPKEFYMSHGYLSSNSKD